MQKITVLLSSYNGEKYIAEQIESLLSQTIPVDIFVRDDGSSDETVNILEKYKQDGKLEYISCENVGITVSFFELLRLAPLSDYYAFCDQDDVWDSDKIEVALDRLKNEDNEIPLLYLSDVRPVDQNLNILPYVAKKCKFKLTLGESLVQAVASGCTFVFNEQTRLLVKDDDAGNISIHDWYMHKAVAAFGKIIYDDVPHISYRQHGGNAIGIGRRGFFKKLKSFLFGKSKCVRSSDAITLEKCHRGQFKSEDEKNIADVVSYKKGIKAKFKLIRNKKVKMALKKENFYLFFVILFGRL